MSMPRCRLCGVQTLHSIEVCQQYLGAVFVAAALNRPPPPTPEEMMKMNPILGNKVCHECGFHYPENAPHALYDCERNKKNKINRCHLCGAGFVGNPYEHSCNTNIPDPIDHPQHYNTGKIEVIDFIEDQKLGFSLGNAVKYISRAGKKDQSKKIEDLKKAIWYIEREIGKQ